MFSQDRVTTASTRRTIDQHELLLAHIEAGDGAAAEALWRDYWSRYTRDADTTIADVLTARG